MRRIAIVALAVLVGAIQAARAAEAESGEDIFGDNCLECHSPDPGIEKTGPSLAGIVGRRAGSVAGFPYSPAMASAHLVWTKATLDRYITDPQAMLPGIKMTFPGLKDAAARKALIDYLATLKD